MKIEKVFLSDSEKDLPTELETIELENIGVLVEDWDYIMLIPVRGQEDLFAWRRLPQEGGSTIKQLIPQSSQLSRIIGYQNGALIYKNFIKGVEYFICAKYH